MTKFVAVVARGVEALLEAELRGFGATDTRIAKGAVEFEADTRGAYTALLASRLASRILLPVATIEGASFEALDEAVASVRWLSHVRADGTLAVEVAASAGVDVHTRYAAQRTKDGICDQIRAARGVRPSVDVEKPDVAIHVHLGPESGTVAIDLASGSMHRRGYRARGADAPLKETLAAAILGFAGWPRAAADGLPLVDPMCGSGTFLVEAALIAASIAPGLLRKRHPIERWLGFESGLFDQVARELDAVGKEGRASATSRLIGFDASEAAIESTRRALEDVGLSRLATLRRAAIEETCAPEGISSGVLVVNPPYGERLGNESELGIVYESLGDTLKRGFRGFDAFVLTSSPSLAKRIGLRATQKIPLYNGPLECRLLHYPISSEAPKAIPKFRQVHEESKAFSNRLEKNLRTIGKRAERESLDVVRLYDADIPEFNVAVDRYLDHVIVHEYAAPRSVDPEIAARRLRDVMQLVADVLSVPRERVHLAVRRRQTSGSQYERADTEGVELVIREGACSFEVRLGERLDSGYFPDHRLLRARAAELARGKTFLNLFAYTCTASVVAALAGARTTSVDLSQTYIDWGERNFRRNGLDLRRHTFVRGDCFRFLAEDRGHYDVVFLNPPSYSRSHRMDGDFSVIRDQAQLLRSAVERLSPGGVVVFSTHARGFQLDPVISESYAVEDVSERSVPFDYVRSPHRAYLVRAR